MSITDWLKRCEATLPDSGKTIPCLEMRVIDALRTVFDEEIPINIYDLGLVYELHVDETRGSVRVAVTLTTPGCPVAQTFPVTVEDAVRLVTGVNDVQVKLVWEPPWSKERMSEAARLQLEIL